MYYKYYSRKIENISPNSSKLLDLLVIDELENDWN